MCQYDAGPICKAEFRQTFYKMGLVSLHAKLASRICIIFLLPFFAFAILDFRLWCCNSFFMIRNDFQISDLRVSPPYTKTFCKPSLLQRVFEKYDGRRSRLCQIDSGPTCKSWITLKTCAQWNRLKKNFMTKLARCNLCKFFERRVLLLQKWVFGYGAATPLARLEMISTSGIYEKFIS